MPFVFKDPRRPEPWRKYRQGTRPISAPFYAVEWLAEWASWCLSRWVLLEVLEYCGTLSILVGVIFYFAGTKDRREQRHYQAWQVINTAQGKGGNGGRLDALQDLNEDHIPLVAVDLTGGAYLQNIRLPHASLRRCKVDGADMRGAILTDADLEDASMLSTNLRGADLSNARFAGITNLTGADLNGANLYGVDLSQVKLDGADLRNTDLSAIANWQSIGSINLANLQGCRNPPSGFLDWAKNHGAVQIDSDADWAKLLRNANLN
jgi:uncharacterized protein YjbI with pentapeptide repeats